MTARPIVYLPDPRLKQRSKPVDAITPEIEDLVLDMFDSMEKANGIGLAAVQIGVMKRVVVMDVPLHEEECCDDECAHKSIKLILINPDIIEQSEQKSSYKEGCLSIPEIEEEVIRPETIRVRYMDLEGETKELEADGLLATCIQHEIDHLNGTLFIDYLSKFKRDRIVTKFKKLAKKNALT